MKITPLHTSKIEAGATTIGAVLDTAFTTLPERSVVVVTSKIIALCDNRVALIAGTDREALIRQQSSWYHDPPADTQFRYHFTISQNTLIPAAGIDISNGNGYYVLWPANAVASANHIRRHLTKRFGVKALGVIVTDSTISLSRWGTQGIAIGHSGFKAVNSYIGQPDLFGQTLQLSQANLAGGLAAAAVVVMGEGAEQTPLALIENPPNLEFHARDCTPEELKAYYVSPLQDEPFMPCFTAVQWRRGGQPINS